MRKRKKHILSLHCRGSAPGDQHAVCQGNQQALAEAPETLSPLQLVSDFKQTLSSHPGCGLVMGRCRSG